MERPPMEMALSTDVVMDIVLSQLKVEDLLSCRQVSKFWNKAASSVLRRRSTTVRNISEETVLMELQECMTTSSDFPFTGLKFNWPWWLQSAGAMGFFQNYGARFTSLYLGTWSDARPEEIAPILNHFPRLSILEVDDPDGDHPPAELSDSAAGQDDDKIVNLPSLRCLKIHSDLNEDVLREVCTAASPSLRIQCLYASHGILRSLKRVGKLEALSFMNVDQDDDEKDYALRVDELLSTQPPALTKLDLNDGGCVSRKGLITLLISSQHTLKYLRLVAVCPSEFSSECPVLSKLTTLSLWIVGVSCEYGFQGRQGHKFPALKRLQLDMSFEDSTSFILSDGLFIVPSLKTIDLDSYVSKCDVEDLARSFPNVIEIRLSDDDRFWSWCWKNNRVDIGSFGAFKFLEKLKIWHGPVEPSTRSYINMDSFLTGLPIAICENLRKQKGQNLMDSPFNEILRDSPRFLQLKNLKELAVYVSTRHPMEELPEEPPFISMVSVWYALQKMPNLRVKFMYNYNSPSWSLEEKQRDKAITMLKTAFKQVQPYVELEPFYY